MNIFLAIFKFPFNLIGSNFYWYKTNKQLLPGYYFFKYGKSVARKLLVAKIFSQKLFLNPVSIVRYFEYDFAIHSIGNATVGSKILDVSSPYLFGFYLFEKFKINYHYINPDNKDLNKVKMYKTKLGFGSGYSTKSQDATHLSDKNGLFDIIISISVIEHINSDGDTAVVKEMWRTLKTGGKLIITFPVEKKFREEFSEEDVYQLGFKKANGKFFFQRFYDNAAINTRLLGAIENYSIVSKKIFGENKKEFYSTYKYKWQKKGYSETIKDPYYISKYFKEFNSIEELPGIGVVGITLRKEK